MFNKRIKKESIVENVDVINNITELTAIIDDKRVCLGDIHEYLYENINDIHDNIKNKKYEKVLEDLLLIQKHTFKSINRMYIHNVNKKTNANNANKKSNKANKKITSTNSANEKITSANNTNKKTTSANKKITSANNANEKITIANNANKKVLMVVMLIITVHALLKKELNNNKIKKNTCNILSLQYIFTQQHKI